MATANESDKQTVLAEIRAAGSKHAARCAEIESGTAEPWVYESLKTAYSLADEDDPDEKMRSYAASLIAQLSDEVVANGEVDTEAIGETIGRKILEIKKILRDGIGPLAFLRPNHAPWDYIRADLGAARTPLLRPPTLELPVLDESVSNNIAAWRKANDARSERQTTALEGMLSLLERETNRARILLIATVIAACAGTVAAIVGIISLVG